MYEYRQLCGGGALAAMYSRAWSVAGLRAVCGGEGRGRKGRREEVRRQERYRLHGHPVLIFEDSVLNHDVSTAGSRDLGHAGSVCFAPVT